MFKHFLTANGNRIETLIKTPNFKIPFSHLHTSRKTLISNPAIDFLLDEVEELQSSKPEERITQLPPEHAQTDKQSSSKELPSLQISHPWPEWVELMEHLLKKGYFDKFGNPFENDGLGAKDSHQIRNACLNFGRDQFEVIRYLSRKDIKVIAESGCPSLDRKVVNSGKRLRAHLGVNEGNVCSSCILRGDCERAYVKAREDEWGRTVDVMRFILTYGLDPITGSVENKPCLNKMVKESVRRLLKEVLKFSVEERGNDLPEASSSKNKLSIQGSSSHQANNQIKVPTKQGDWRCPKCNFLNFARNIKCLKCDELSEERLRILREDQDHLPLKKGDWICATCNFFNFAKNTRCFLCKEKPPRRQINPGEWECESCNYINFRRNMVCLKCDHRRPKASIPEGNSTPATNDNGDCRNSRPHFGQDREVENTEANIWKFVEDESEIQEGLNSWNEVPDLVDFPVVGGKSDLSQNIQKRESWKQEMAERSRSIASGKKNADKFKSAIMQRCSNFLESTDDEEMAEWFGCEGSKGQNFD